MGTIIERVDVAHGGWRSRHSALRLAVNAATTCLDRAGRSPDDLDLLVNAGIYRDRNLGEPALAAMIQEDIGAHPEDPHADAHGTFSFDVANGTCGVLTGLQIVDGFLRSRTIRYALVVASDADPGRGMSEDFPFSATGGAVLCSWTDRRYGLGRVHWANADDDLGGAFRATVGHLDNRNVLRVDQSEWMDARYAAAAAAAVTACLKHASLQLGDIDRIVAAPARPQFRTELAQRLELPESRITIAADHRMHTAALVAGLDGGDHHVPAGTRTLIVAAGAGVTAGAALYEEPPAPGTPAPS
jgi:3-oxoacyl-[acyl-carrier-protein] synthase-3